MQRQVTIRVTEIDRDPDQPRKTFSEAELMAFVRNLKQQGVRVPVIVYPVGTRYVLADGERRWRAARRVGLKQVSVFLPKRRGVKCFRKSRHR